MLKEYMRKVIQVPHCRNAMETESEKRVEIIEGFELTVKLNN